MHYDIRMVTSYQWECVGHATSGLPLFLIFSSQILNYKLVDFFAGYHSYIIIWYYINCQHLLIKFYSYMWPFEQKPDMLAYKLKFIILLQLIATLNNYACSLPHWIMSTGLLLKSAFVDHINPRLVNGANGGLQFDCGDLICLLLSAHACLVLVVEYWPFVDACGHHSQSKLYHLCHLASLF